MFITFTTDMVLKRMFYQQGLILMLHEELMYSLLMNRGYDDRERIINKDGKVISRWR